MATVKLFDRLRALRAEIDRLQARTKFASAATGTGGHPVFTAELTEDGGLTASGTLPGDEMAAFTAFLAQEEIVAAEAREEIV